MYRVAPEESALIFMATDGLWDTVSLSAVAAELPTAGESEACSRAETAARQMRSLALHKKTRDDCTVMVVEVLSRVAGSVPGGGSFQGETAQHGAEHVGTTTSDTGGGDL